MLDLSRRNNGTTAGDGSFDLDGATGTLHYYASFGRRWATSECCPMTTARSSAATSTFWTRHVWVPRQGVAVGINAFNFPAWGFAEKAPAPSSPACR